MAGAHCRPAWRPGDGESDVAKDGKDDKVAQLGLALRSPQCKPGRWTCATTSSGLAGREIASGLRAPRAEKDCALRQYHL